jgi:lipid-A-disaccharide synthase
MPKHIFISAGEPSGDLHGANLIRAFRRLDPNLQCVGFGGEKMESAGCRLLYPLTRLAVMWFARVLARAPLFLDLLSRADRYFRHRRPEAVILIDYPGFHWWLARRAHFHGIPVFYFVPPQLWGWAGWRVKKMRRWVDHVLCALPFEEPWYRSRGMPAHYVGHPYFDELPEQRLDRTFLNEHRSQNGPIIGLLPGSRNQEVERNLSSLIRAAEMIHASRPDARFLVACFKPSHRQYIEERLTRIAATRSGAGQPPVRLPIETCVGKTAEVIELAHACIAVSGSVGLELLYRRRPSVVLYRIGWLDLKVCNVFKTAQYISLVNMLAGKELFPEFLTDRCEAQAISRHIIRWLNEPETYHTLCQELKELRARVAEPGACERAARMVLTGLNKPQPLPLPPPLKVSA